MKNILFGEAFVDKQRLTKKDRPKDCQECVHKRGAAACKSCIVMRIKK